MVGVRGYPSLKTHFDVRAFGAVAGAAADQTAAFNRAITAAAATPGPAIVMIPPGTFSLAPSGDPYAGQGGNTIRMLSGVTLQGTPGSKLKVMANAGAYGAVVYGYTLTDAHVKGLRIDANTANNPVLPSAVEGNECHAVRFQHACADCSIEDVIVDPASGRHTLIFDASRASHHVGATAVVNTNCHIVNFRVRWVDPTNEAVNGAVAVGANTVITLTRGSTPAWMQIGTVLVLEGNLAEQATINALPAPGQIRVAAVANAGHTRVRALFDNTAIYLYAEGSVRHGRITTDSDNSMAGAQTAWEAQGGPFTVEDLRCSNFAFGFDVTPDPALSSPCFVDNIYADGLGAQFGAIYPADGVAQDIIFGKLEGRFTQANHNATLTTGIGMFSSPGMLQPASRIVFGSIIMSFQDEGAGRAHGVNPDGTLGNTSGQALDFQSYGTVDDVYIGQLILENPPCIGVHLSGIHAVISKLTIGFCRIVNAGQNLAAPGTNSALSAEGVLTDVSIDHLQVYDTYNPHRMTNAIIMGVAGTYTRCFIRRYRKNATDGAAIPDTLQSTFQIEDNNGVRSLYSAGSAVDTLALYDDARDKVFRFDDYGRIFSNNGSDAGPSLTAIGNLGSTGTATLEVGSTDLWGHITVTPSGVGIAAGSQFTFNFGKAMPNAKFAVTIQQVQDDAASGFFLSGVTTNYGPASRTVNSWNFVINTALTTGHTYHLHYKVHPYGS